MAKVGGGYHKMSVDKHVTTKTLIYNIIRFIVVFAFTPCLLRVDGSRTQTKQENPGKMTANGLFTFAFRSIRFSVFNKAIPCDIRYETE